MTRLVLMCLVLSLAGCSADPPPAAPTGSAPPAEAAKGKGKGIAME
jgi:hypothetical protein